MSRTLNVDRMRRYRDRSRTRHVWGKDEVRDMLRLWAATTDPSDRFERVNGLLHWVKGPYPEDSGDPVELFDAEARELLTRQRRAGITVDGILGPQSWGVVAEQNQANRP